MNTTLFAVGVLFFIFPAFVARAGHYTTSYYRFSRLNKAEKFLPYFSNEWQIILLYALVYSAIINISYAVIIAFSRPEWLKICAKDLVFAYASIVSIDRFKEINICDLVWSCLRVSGLYIGLLAFTYMIAWATGFIRWNIIELRWRTVPSQWFYLIRPVGDNKFTVLDILTGTDGPTFPIMYRGVATGTVPSVDGGISAIILSRAYRLELPATAINPASENFVSHRIPGEHLVIKFDEIKNINIAMIYYPQDPNSWSVLEIVGGFFVSIMGGKD